jgi:alpha-N-arabinofuranosidase
MMQVEPYICLNMGTGTLTGALAWVEYCNSTGNTYYANLRRQNGHPEPYHVRYWALGNEIYGSWQVEAQSKEGLHQQSNPMGQGSEVARS